MSSRKRSRLNLPSNNNSVPENNTRNTTNYNNGNPIRKRGRFEDARKSVGFAPISNTRNYNRNLPPTTVSAPPGLRRPVATKPPHITNLPERSLNTMRRSLTLRQRLRNTPESAAAANSRAIASGFNPHPPPILQPPTFIFPNPSLPRFGNTPPVSVDWSSLGSSNGVIRNQSGNPLPVTYHRPRSGGKYTRRRLHTKK